MPRRSVRPDVPVERRAGDSQLLAQRPDVGLTFAHSSLGVNVCSWHLADIAADSEHVRFGG